MFAPDANVQTSSQSVNYGSLAIYTSESNRLRYLPTSITQFVGSKMLGSYLLGGTSFEPLGNTDSFPCLVALADNTPTDRIPNDAESAAIWAKRVTVN